MSATKFHIHTKQRAKLRFYISWSLNFSKIKKVCFQNTQDIIQIWQQTLSRWASSRNWQYCRSMTHRPRHFDTIPSFHDTEHPLEKRPWNISSGFLKFSYRWASLVAASGEKGKEATYCYVGGIATVMALHLNHFTRSKATTLRPTRVALRFEENIKIK